MVHMSYAHFISHTVRYDHYTDTYERRHMCAYTPICAYMSIY